MHNARLRLSYVIPWRYLFVFKISFHNVSVAFW